MNAVLKQFNIVADRGYENTTMFQKKGLQFAILDKNGNKLGVPIKASSFYSKPTLRNIEKKFEVNKENRKSCKQDLIKRVDKVMGKFNALTKTTLVAELNKQGINLVLRENAEGLIYGITFVDHINKTVFNGSDLGKNYSAKSILEIIGNKDQLKTYLQTAKTENSFIQTGNPSKSYLEPSLQTNYLANLLGKAGNELTPSVGHKQKKKRKRITR